MKLNDFNSFLFSVLTLLFVACGGSSSQNPPSGNGQCAETIQGPPGISVPTRLVNSPSACDYLLEGYVELSSTLEVEPGVVIVAGQDASLVVDGGQIIAEGREDARIVFEGLNHVKGYWNGIRFNEGRESRFDYVDIKDAGQECTSLFCADAGLILSDVTVSLTNTTVSNGYVNGVAMSSTTLLTAFANNRFYGNIGYGLVADASQLGALDAASDYLGGDDPNGFPYVLLGADELTQDATWQPLNAPYLVDGFLDVKATLTLKPGVTLFFDEEARMDVYGGLLAVGTAEAPIVLTSKTQTSGFWSSISFRENSQSRLEYTQVSYGNGLYLTEDARLFVANSSLANSSSWGINCYDPEFDDYVLELGSGNTFNNNTEGDVAPECRATP